MKKSQLRNIIRESIKEMMTEQSGSAAPGPYHVWNINYSSKIGIRVPSQAWAVNCSQNQGTPGTNCFLPAHSQQLHTNWGSPSPGMIAGVHIQNGSGPYTNSACLTPEGCIRCFEYTGTVDCTFNPWPSNVCVEANGTSHTTFTFGTISSNHPYATHTSFGTFNNVQDCQAAGATLLTGTTGCPIGSCDQSAWPNYNNWVSNWTSGGPFSPNNNNPNQPCNHICNKIQQWTNACNNAGPVQQNQLACKIEKAQNLHNQNSCATNQGPTSSC